MVSGAVHDHMSLLVLSVVDRKYLEYQIVPYVCLFREWRFQVKVYLYHFLYVSHMSIFYFLPSFLWWNLTSFP